MKVKGTVIVDLVRIIRSQKDIDWSKYLEPEDFEIVKSLIVPGKWYPGDSFWRISWAVTKEIGKVQIDNIFFFGRLTAKSFVRVYKQLLVEGDPSASLENSVRFRQAFYDFEGTEYEKNKVEKGPDWIKFTIYDYPDMIIPEVRVPYYYGIAGYFQEVAEMASGKTIKNTIVDKGNFFEMTFSWGDDK